MDEETKNMTPTERWCYDDAVLFDTEAGEVISYLIEEGHSLENAVEIVETTQNVKIKWD